MSIIGKIQSIFLDREKTQPIFPITKTKAVSDDAGRNLDVILDDKASKDFVTAEIAKAQLGGESGEIDLSGFATKDDINSHANSKSNPHGVTTEQIGAAPAGYGVGSDSKVVSGDMNNAIIGGVYYYGNVANRPTDSAGVVFVKNRSDAQIFQTATDIYGLSAERIRQSNGAWSDWVQCDPSAFAPSGYGLGVETAEKIISDYNTAVRNGWYRVDGNASNAPWTFSSWMRVDAYNENYLVQTVYNEADGCRVAQRLKQKTWGEWEWVNPPMLLGVEYRTTERENGNAIYVKEIKYGKGPSGGAANLHGGYPKNAVFTEVNCKGVRSDGWGSFLNQYLSFGENGATGSGSMISLSGAGDLSQTDIYLTAKYYKA